MIEHIMARYGEISLKGNNRGEFERILVRNMRQALWSMPQVTFQRAGGRVMVTLHGADPDAVTTALARVFGIVSLSKIQVVGLEIQDMVDAGVELLKRVGGKTFKVEAKRANKHYPLQSPEIAQRVGGGILASLPDWRVDVHHPDVIVNVEVRDSHAFVFGEKTPAVGGLPVGSAGRVGLLLSGGIDSPVAGWLAMKRGVELEGIHFHSYPFTSERALQKVETLAEILAQWGGRVRLHTVHFTKVQTEIRKNCPDELSITIMRRMMMRIATKLAEKRNLLALVTGESLGQVASQTLESMQVINAVTNIPILRPLVAEDKVDIIRKARKIGTYETSILPYEDCCTVFVPKNPRTRPRISEAEAAEHSLAVEDLVIEAVNNTELKTFLAEGRV